MSLPESPNSNVEQYLSKISGQTSAVPEAPNSRVEQYLEYIAQNGTVSKEEIAEQVSEWLEENIHEDPTVVIDASLSVSGAAADAKATGDEIADLKADLDESIDDLKGVLEFHEYVPSAADSNIFEYTFQDGKWYKIVNKGNWKYRVSFSKDNSIVLSGGYLLPYETIYVRVPEQATSINFYTESSTSDSTKVIIYEGESIDPQVLDGCYNYFVHAYTSQNATYTYSIPRGTGVKAVNEGTIDCVITFRNGGTVTDRIGTVSAGETKYIVLEHDIDTVNCYNVTTGNGCKVRLYIGEIVTAQAVAPNVADINKRLGNAVYGWLCDGYYVAADGSLTPNSSRSVAVFDAKKYAGCKINGYTRLANGSSICTYDRNGIFVSCLYSYSGNQGADYNYDVTIPANAWYILISCGTARKADFTINIENITAGLGDHYTTSPIDYDPPYFVEGQVKASADFPWSSTTKVNDVHRWYSELRIAFGKNLSMTKLGVTSTPTGEYAAIDNKTYDIWAYTYQGDNYIAGNDFILYSGMHGSVALTERTDIGSGEGMQGMISLAYWLKDMLMNPGKNGYLNYIRNYCRILIVPMVNPWGVQNGTRANGRGVDCNRNWDLNFVPNVIYADTNTSSGPEAFSENETRLLKDYVVANFPNAKFSIDIHSRGTSYLPNDTRWLIHSCEEGETTINKSAADVANYMTQRYDGMSELVPDTERRQVSKNYFNFVLNIPGILIETASAMAGNVASLNGEMVQVQYTQMLGAFLQTLVDRLMIHPEQ